MVDWPVTLAFSKALLAFAGAASWPAAAAFIALNFKEPLSGAIARAKKVSVFGVEAELPTQVANQADAGLKTIPGAEGKRLSVSPTPPFDEVLSPKDAIVRAMIEEQPLSPEDKYAWAIRVAAGYATTADNERAYRLIYGSQIKLMKHINVVQSIPISAAPSFFEENRDRSVNSPVYNYEAWLGFLTNGGLVEKADSSPESVLRLTANGRNFLLWMVAQRAPEEKPF